MQNNQTHKAQQRRKRPCLDFRPTAIMSLALEIFDAGFLKKLVRVTVIKNRKLARK
jgi:hypothetical protein